METRITKWGNSFAVRLPKEASLQNLVDHIGEDNKQGLFMLRDKPRGKEIW